MLSKITRRSSIILVVPVILYLFLGGCAAAPTTPDPTRPDNEPVSLESAGQTKATLAPTLESQAAVTPKPTSLSAETLSPSILELILQGQGFGQDGNLLVYGFEIENPNTMAVSGNTVEILAYDENGILAGSTLENVPLLLPGELVGIAGALRLDNDLIVNQIQLQITTGDNLELDTVPDLTVLGVDYRPSEIYNRATGLIINEGDLELEDIRISALAYSSDGRIVGAGYTFLSFLPSGGEAGVDIALTTNELIDRVELYPRVSLATLLSSRLQRPRYTSELDILDHGFSQEGIEVGYGFLMANPNLSHVLENTEYRVTFFDDGDKVIAVDQGHIDLLVPNQIFGIGDHVFVDDGETVDRMEVLARPGVYKPVIPEPILATENVTIITSTLGMLVRGEITNPYQTELENVFLSAVIYNDAGQIVGGGYDRIDNMPPAGQVTVELWVTAPRGPVAAELFAGITELVAE